MSYSTNDIGHREYPSPNMPPTELPSRGQGEYFSNKNPRGMLLDGPKSEYHSPGDPASDGSGSNSSGYWCVALNPRVGEEGATPYLHEQNFDKAEDILDLHDAEVDNECLFNSFQEAHAWRGQSRLFNPQTAADITIPRTVEQKKAAVKLVFKAFKSVAVATDNAGMLKAFEEQRHDSRQVEVLCWAIVEGCIDRCDRGPLLNAYEPDKAKDPPNIKTFADRLDAVVVSLSHQKTICKHLLDAPFLNRFLDDPVGSKQRVESNRKLNKKKGGVMNIGKKALGITSKKGKGFKRKRSDSDSEDELDEYTPESQDLIRSSSGISSPFQTPDRPILPFGNAYSAPAGFQTNPLYSAQRFQDASPTPLGRRHRADNSISSILSQSQTPRSPFLQQYEAAATQENSRHGSQSPPMGALPGPMMDGTMMDPGLTSLNSGFPYGSPHAAGFGLNNITVSKLPQTQMDSLISGSRVRSTRT
jgi:hypothetical protein